MRLKEPSSSAQLHSPLLSWALWVCLTCWVSCPAASCQEKKSGKNFQQHLLAEPSMAESKVIDCWVGGGDGFSIWSLSGLWESQGPQRRHRASSVEARPVSEAGTKQGHRERGRNSDLTMQRRLQSQAVLLCHAWLPQRNVLTGACGAEKGHPQELKLPGTSQGQRGEWPRGIWTSSQALLWTPWTQENPRSPHLQQSLTQSAPVLIPALPVPVLNQSRFQVLQGQSIMCANLGISPNFSSDQRLVKLWNL